MTARRKSAIEILRRRGLNDGDIRVVIDGEVLVTLERYPVESLARSLEGWLGRVDDSMTAECFVFHDDERPELTGTFRIEPRPVDWQFTSMKEKCRHPRMIPLSEYRAIVQNFIADAT